MASRLLLSNAIKASRPSWVSQAVRPLSISAATQAARSSALKNGLTVVTDSDLSAQTASIGVYVDAGSRSETINGTVHLLEQVALKGTNSRSAKVLDAQVESIGASLDVNAGREQIAYTAKSLAADLPKSIEVLADVIQNASLNVDAVDAARSASLAGSESPAEIVFEHLHATAFQGSSLGRKFTGIADSVQTLTRDDLANFVKKNYTTDRMVLVGAGNVDHDALVALAEKHFNQISASVEPTGLGKSNKFAPSFIGSEVRLQDDTMEQAHIVLAVEGCSRSSPDHYTLEVMKTIIGSWDRSLGAAAHTSSRLAAIVNDNKFANSFVSFNKAYTDTGLFGMYFVTENNDCQDDFVHFLQKEWARLSASVTDVEVEQARQKLKASLRLNLDGPSAVAEDLGRQLAATGKHDSVEVIEKALNKITAADVRRVASEYLWDREIAFVGLGPIECLPDYGRIRGNMSWNRV
ncbi:hypothetical protein BGW38_006584 [Lunasporangiospora selenospora]|uniref:mitochondrial processing peptidase n=1 Tax=Lunasporangiospora selenospora TaxID=979761 RepID=A0A9P6FYY5_9FUNG|nr:hypothetical protein BGW38_006584 [Lunasporangiospora selenospora]